MTREIVGISGGLRAIQTNGGTPVLQLSNLHGDTIATVGLSETEPKLLSASDTTEFGVPRTSSPPRYNWLGADELPTELSSGVINMGARTYVPELGRFEQTDPQPGGSGNAYTYTHNDPVNQADPTGEWTNTVSYDYEAAETGASHGLAETYTGPGAILPPPVNAQIEEEFVAHPPWNAAVAFESGIENGQPSSAEMAEILGCTGDHACASSIFGAVEHWVSSNAHKLVAAGIGAVSSIVVGVVTLVAVTGCAGTAELTADPFVAYDCYKIGSIGFSVAIGGAASTVDAWKVEKN